MYNGGCCGSASNIWMQLSFLVQRMKENYRELGHTSHESCFKNNVYDKGPVDHSKAVCLLQHETQEKMYKEAQKIEDNYVFGKDMWPPVKQK